MRQTLTLRESENYIWELMTQANRTFSHHAVEVEYICPEKPLLLFG